MMQTTRLSKLLASLLLLLFLINYFFPETSGYLALVPGRTLPCVWNLVTASLLTLNPVELFINVVGLLVLARLVEPVYGSKEFLKFIGIVNVLVSIAIFAAVYIVFISTTSGKLLYTKFGGFHGIIAALLVALKQIMPAHEIKVLGFFRLKVKYLPSVIMVVVVLVAVLLDRRDYLAFYVTGTYSSWLYLRFFQRQPDNGQLGDASDQFKFSSFFPETLAPAIDAIATVLGVVTRLRHTHGTDNASATKSLLPTNGPSALGADAADANRRRERGAKALEERLGMKKGAATGAEDLPTDVEAAVLPPSIPAVES